MSNLAVMTPILEDWMTSLIIRNLIIHLPTMFNLPFLSILGFQPHSRLDIGFRLTSDSSNKVSVYTFLKKTQLRQRLAFCQRVSGNQSSCSTWLYRAVIMVLDV